MILTLAMQAAVFIMAPDLPVFSDATFDEAAAKFWPATAMVLVVADETYTQQDWERSALADRELVAFFDSKRIPVVYADIHENRAACWLLDVDRLPAVIVFVGGEERGRRYGLPIMKAEQFVEWFELLGSGSSPAEELRKRITAEPENVRLRAELIRELSRSGNGSAAHSEIVWFLMHPDQVDGMYDRPPTEAEARLALLSFVGGLREPLSLWPKDQQALGPGEHRLPRGRTWAEVEQLAVMPDFTQKSTRNIHHLAKLIVEVRDTLQSRVVAETASERDRFVLDALTLSETEFQALAKRLSEHPRPHAESP